MSRTNQILIIVSLIVLSISPSFAEWSENAKAIDISGGEDHTLVLTANNWPWACGPNGGPGPYYGVLGTGSTSTALIAKTLIRVWDGDMTTPSDYLEHINDIEAGWKHSLALDVNSYVWAWGNDDWGQLGNGPAGTSTTPVQVHGVDDQGFLQSITTISAGRSGQHSLAVDADAYAYGWGYNKYGQCGNDESNNSKLTPVRVHRGEQPEDLNDPNNWLKHIIDICAGADQSIALEKDDPTDQNFSGCVYTWGTNWWGDEDYEWIEAGYGLLGTGSNVALEDAPVKVHGVNDVNFLEHIVAVAAGWDHCIALEKDDPWDQNLNGRVFTWGNNGPGWGGGETGQEWETSVGGRLGDGTTTSRSTPVLVLKGQQETSTSGYLEHIIAISAGEGHSMALDGNGYVYCWGDNQYGQLGNGFNDPCTTPVRVINPQDPNLPLSGIVAISAGHWHSLAIDSNGVVWAWGKGSAGRLGLGNKTIDCNTPHRIPVVYNVTQETFHFAIQPALNDANEGDVLEASRGIYYENVVIQDENITLKSEDPEDPEVVADTVVDARYNAGEENEDYYAVNFHTGSGSTLAGLTLSESAKRGVNCEHLSSAYLSNCVIQDNSWDGIYSNHSSVDIIGCEIRRNASASYPDCYGIYCVSGSDVNIANCVIAENEGSGIWSQDSSLGLRNSIIEDNADYGIYEYNPPGASIIANNIFRGNGDDAIYFAQFASGPEIRNNWIYSNAGSGIETYNSPNIIPEPSAAIVNNTIVGNDEYGVESNYAADVEISNCIIWDNGSDELHAGDSDTFTVTYSCIEGGYGVTEDHNIESAPRFVEADFNNFHLGGGSPCIDTGDPDFEPEPNETDIDGEYRIINERVDMGADEFCRATDFNGDGLVNFVDYSMLARHWLQAAADAGYSDAFDLWDDDVIDFNDVLELCKDWLVTAECRTESMLLMAGCGGGMAESLSLQAASSELAVVEKEAIIVEPVDVEKLLDWLAEIWLDPEVREGIDAESWLNLYQSLKE